MAATSEQRFDDRGGNAWSFITLQHVYHASQTSTFSVDNSAINAVHSPSAGQTSVTATLVSSVAGSGVQAITIPATSASGEYTIIVRHAGSAAGTSSSKNYA